MVGASARAGSQAVCGRQSLECSCQLVTGLRLEDVDESGERRSSCESCACPCGSSFCSVRLVCPCFEFLNICFAQVGASCSTRKKDKESCYLSNFATGRRCDGRVVIKYDCQTMIVSADAAAAAPPRGAKTIRGKIKLSEICLLQNVWKSLRFLPDFAPHREVPEQVLALRHIGSSCSCSSGKETKKNSILEIGGGAGRVSMVVDWVLRGGIMDHDQQHNSDSTHIVLETIPEICATLEQHRTMNHCRFRVVEGTISRQQLRQKKVGGDMRTSRHEILNEDSGAGDWLDIRTHDPGDFFRDNGPFSTIIADCEGHLVDIFRDLVGENLLSSLETVIIEHDFRCEADWRYFLDWMLGASGAHEPFHLVDYVKKGGAHCRGKNWPGGVRGDALFASVWKRGAALCREYDLVGGCPKGAAFRGEDVVWGLDREFVDAYLMSSCNTL